MPPPPDPDPCALTEHGPRDIQGLLTTTDRLTAWAEWFGLETPPLRYTRGRPTTPGNLLLTDELLTWMIHSGGSLDWFVMGDPRGMAIAFRRAELPMAQLRGLICRLDEVEAEIFVEAVHEGREGGEALERALVECQVKIDARRAQKALAA